ncbi:agmatinase [Desulfoscipio geothermicus]|uniref:Agmatinase n=1 Tax=Desulfoscipio geothermicus DSM 3669 TaxID=1121426 RepID=A0A1I6DIE8_9FIRM|nr:agmatinase [Desulfoscipio geothermicus]SFR05240.1 agmatinase [Desulfoscipio geothermicus DSM 3669]
MTKYQPINSFESPRFCGVRTFMRLPNKRTLTDVDFIVSGIPFDTGGSFRIGTRFGPQAIRDASILLRPYNPVLDVNIFDYCSGVDYGDIDVVPGYIEESYQRIEESITPIFESDVVPIFLGGDHSVTLPELRAVAKSKGPVALVHFDSHSDTWDSYFEKSYNHGTPIRRAIEEKCLLVENSIQVGMRGPLYGPEDLNDAREMGLEVLTTQESREIGIAETVKRIKERVQDKPVFVTFDIDFLDPVYAPGTGTPEIGGFTTWEAQHLVREGLRGLNFVGFDLVEVLPSYDSNQVTAFAAAGIVYEFISLLALNRKGI